MAKTKAKVSVSRKELEFIAPPLMKTPLDHLNIVTGGGLRPSTFTELWGENRSGKSAFAYQTAASFLKQFEDGIVVVLDTERASDPIRLKHAFGIDISDTERFQVKVTPTLEKSFKLLFETMEAHAEDERPRLIIWDTISVNPTEKEFESDDMFAGGQNEKIRVIKHKLGIALGKMSGNIWVLILNQVMVDRSKTFAVVLKSGGGHGLHHNIHYSFHFKSVEGSFDEDDDATQAIKTIAITKSRFSPEVRNIYMVVDVQKGGVIQPVASLIQSGIKRKFITMPTKGWWAWHDDPSSKFRQSDLVNQPELVKLLRKELKQSYRNKFLLLDLLYTEQAEARKLLGAGKKKKKRITKD